MRKYITLVLCALLVIAAFTGCEKDVKGADIATTSITKSESTPNETDSMVSDVDYAFVNGYSHDNQGNLNKIEKISTDAKLTIPEDYAVKAIENTVWMGMDPNLAKDTFNSFTKPLGLNSLYDPGVGELDTLEVGGCITSSATGDRLIDLPEKITQNITIEGYLKDDGRPTYGDESINEVDYVGEVTLGLKYIDMGLYKQKLISEIYTKLGYDIGEGDFNKLLKAADDAVLADRTLPVTVSCTNGKLTHDLTAQVTDEGYLITLITTVSK